MENWQENVGTGHTHEPHEVTIQLDGLGRKLRDLPVEPLAAAPDGAEGPVFVDESGRRSRKLRLIGWVLAAACAGYAITLVAALLGGNSSAPWMPGLGGAGDRKPDHVQIQPAPTDRQTTVATPHAPPGTPVRGDSGDATPPGPSAGADVGRSLPATQPSASAASSAQPVSDGTGGGPAVTSAAPASSAPASGVTTPGEPGLSESAAPGSDFPRQPVREGAL